MVVGAPTRRVRNLAERWLSCPFVEGGLSLWTPGRGAFALESSLLGVAVYRPLLSSSSTIDEKSLRKSDQGAVWVSLSQSRRRHFS